MASCVCFVSFTEYRSTVIVMRGSGKVGDVSTARQMVEIWITKGASHGSYRFFVIIKLQKKPHEPICV
jgi:hypothetical protein